jgi:hypothetical protein
MDNIVGKWMRQTGRILILLLCMMACVSCASGQDAQVEQAGMPDLSAEEGSSAGSQTPGETGSRTPGEESGEEKAPDEERAAEGQEPDAEFPMPDAEEPDAAETEFSPGRQMQENKEQFLEKAKEQKVESEQAEELFERLAADGVFQNGDRALTGLMIDDIDENGQTDMLAMVQDAAERPAYGSGGLWLYMNADEPYCFEEEECSYCGWFDAFWADIDNDENIEIVFSAEGTGCGAVGDSYKAVFKYKGHAIERMKLPSDLDEDYDQGLQVELVQEPVKNVYSAYCPYFDELISFRGQNVEGWETPDAPQIAGGNARGFYELRAVEYEGKKVLQASEYLYGEGGVAHYVATAQFLITWEKDGTPKALKWWIEEAELMVLEWERL